MEMENADEKRRYLKMAADEGDISAMYEYAIETADQNEKQQYLKQAADQGYIPAMHEYARLID